MTVRMEVGEISRFQNPGHFAKRYDTDCRRWFDRKASQTNTVIATQALGCKLAKAAWYVLVKEVNYDPKRMFPEWANKKES